MSPETAEIHAPPALAGLGSCRVGRWTGDRERAGGDWTLHGSALVWKKIHWEAWFAKHHMAKNGLWPILGCTSQIRSVVRNPYVWSALLEMFFENGNDLGQSGKQSRSPRSFVKIPSQSFPLPDPRCISWATLKRNIMELNGFKLRGAGYQV